MTALHRPDGPSSPLLDLRPEQLFQIGPVSRGSDLITASMLVAPWMVEGETEGAQVGLGTLGVLMDDILGSGTVSHRPDGHWPVSTEISVNFFGRRPRPGEELRGQARVIHTDRMGGFGRGDVVDESGQLIAVGTQQLRYVPGDPTFVPSVLTAASQPAPVSVSELVEGRTVLEVLGATLAADDADGVLRLHLKPSPLLSNPMGNLHGGVLLCLSEAAAERAMRGPGAPLVTSSVHISYLRPVPLEQDVTFEVELLHRGRTMATAQVTSRNVAGKLCSVATVTGASG